MAVKHLHFLGIGGVGMAGLAVLLKARGYEVDGCDLKPTERTRWLEAMGIPVFYGHDPAHVVNADEVILTPAISPTNPERLAAQKLVFRGEALARLVSESEGIAICGSHGKTTTATFTAKLLRALGEDVAWCIGGETGDFPVAHAAPGPLVVEADESDGTLALYHTKILVVNTCEYDHPDHFKTPADYFACFDAARANAEVVIESDSLPPLPELAPLLAPLAPHNRKNARAAVEVALKRGHKLPDIVAALSAAIAVLPDRRFQKLADGVYTDYAHHPTEMACAVQMARTSCRGVLRVLFQPHRYSRTKALLNTFPAAFKGVDDLILCPTYSAFEQPQEGGDIADLYRVCREAGLPVRLARSCREAWEHARLSHQEGDLTLLLGAGSIIDLKDHLTDPLVEKRLFIGAGSNTWKSDLKTTEVYVKTSGPAGRRGATLGIPWMVGIPGTIGGWVKMNAGAFGHSISEVVKRVKVDGHWLEASQCGFAYRHSSIVGEIEEVEFRPFAFTESAADYRTRRRKFPSGTWGSVFKNPPNDFAGRLLESVGAKELKVGGAFVWSEHANVIVAGKGATPSDVLALARLMHQRVLLRLGIDLEPEVCGLEVAL